MTRAAICYAAALCVAAIGQRARADVFEIAADGAVAVRARDTGGGLDSADATPDVPAAALTTIETPAIPVTYRSPLTRAADTARVSPALLAALVWQESRWHPAALSPRGARGLTQLMPGTARALAVDPGDVSANLAGGARYLRSMLDRFDGDVERALAAYNAGPSRVPRAGGLPAIAQTRAYVAAIMDRLGAIGTLGEVTP